MRGWRLFYLGPLWMNKSRDAVARMPSVSYAGCRTACTVAANLLCSARIQGNANFGLWLSFSPSLHTSACHSGRCARCFPALLASTRGSELMSPSGDCCGAPVMVSVSCSPVWRSSPGLCILLSAPIQQSAPPPPHPTHTADVLQSRKTSTLGCLIPRDTHCVLLGSISIAA